MFKKRIRIKKLPKSSSIKGFLWLFAAFAILSGALAVMTQIYAERLFGWNSTVYREREEIVLRDTVVINSADITLEVFAYDGDKIIIDYIGETALIIEYDELEIKISRHEDFAFSLFSWDKLNYKMTVYLPKIVYRELRLYSAAGNISAQNIETFSLVVNSRTGSIELFGIEGLISANTRGGDINAEFINFTDACVLETDAGNIAVIMPERYGVKLDFISEYGRFTSDFFEREYNGEQGDLHLSSGNAGGRFTVRTNTGNLNFQKRLEYID